MYLMLTKIDIKVFSLYKLLFLRYNLCLIIEIEIWYLKVGSDVTDVGGTTLKNS